jgi:glycosyltransferase involved in cell wall biosynthesis
LKTLTVVCPVYEEEEVIAAFHGELGKALAGLAGRWSTSVLYVVDRSEDRSLELLRGIAAADPSVRVLALSGHFGQQAALLAGLDHADADAVVMMDADLQHPPSLLPELVARHEQGFDVVHTVREDTDGVPLAKRLSARLYYRLLGAMSPTPIVEGGADFRLLSRRVVRVFQRDIHERTAFLRGLVPWVGFKSIPVRFRAGSRGAGRTKYSLRRMLDFGLGGVVSSTRLPLRAAALCGLLIAGLGLLAGLLSLLAAAVRGSPPSGLWLLFAFFSFVAGLQLVFLGLVGEYVAAALEEARARPRYVVEERINFPTAEDP